MTPKAPTTLKIPAKPAKPQASNPTPADFAARWSEARCAYPLYVTLAMQFNFPPPPHPPGELPPARPTREVFDRDLQWLDAIDEQLRAVQIRQLPPETLNASEEALRAFILRQLKKRDKTTVDRDKIDLLLVQYFALCAPERLYRSEIKLADVASVLRPVLSEADATPLEWCEPIETMLAKVDGSHSLRDLLEEGIFEKGRLLKDSAGCMFYDPAALVTFCRFNFLLRRAFIRMLHADLSAIKQALDNLEVAGIKTADCRRAGFSAAETTVQVRYFCENWRQPFQKDYTANSVTRAFEQLLALRADLEEAVARIGANPAPKPPVQPPMRAATPAPERPRKAAAPAPASNIAAAPKQPASRDQAPPAQKKEQTPAAAPKKPAKAASEPVAAPVDAMDPDQCMEAIWEQLIAAPPSRGRSMSTVVLQDVKVLLSSWEVAAFVSDGDQEAEDLRRAVVARALLAQAMDQRKRSGEEDALASALVLARSEVSYFQGRVEQAKRAKNTEAAVNLGISTKRMLSFIEEAEKLQS
ncbi:MAG TPA: hypothetical protein VN661_03635 [Candidatus Acidoferrales bacterium]|nr:hypothetical protein [Candidatus Acidoferrales bacterium]